MKHVRAHWQGALLVCVKCEKKLGKRGFGPAGDERLSQVLKREAQGKGRKARFGVVPMKCLKLCPKGAVTVVDTRRPGDWLVVRPGDVVPVPAAGIAPPPAAAVDGPLGGRDR